MPDSKLKTIGGAYREATLIEKRESPGSRPASVQLHVIHDLGGGSATWLSDFCLADAANENLVLKSFTQNDAMGCGISLYAHVLDEVPVKMWHFSDQIQATVVTHPEYLSALSDIIEQYCVDALLVSSVIGHSLDVLNTDLPTVVVNHDYFPYCPAINIYFDEVCKTCDPNKIERCYRDNPQFNPFVTFLPKDRVAVREQFLALIARPNVTMVTPSLSVQENLLRLDGRFRQASFVTIAHGYGRELKKVDMPSPSENDRLRILVLGQLSDAKGLELLRGSLDALTKFSEIYLVGCKELGEFFKFKTGVHVLARYEIGELSSHVATINPHVGLLMSIVPETFSYALTELMMLGIPAAATRVGSFPERIEHLQNGYLYEPSVASLLTAMETINDDRQSLEIIRRNLQGWTPRSAETMVADYHSVLPIETPKKSAMGATKVGTDSVEAKMRNEQLSESVARDEIRLTQSLTISSMWKEVKSLHLQLSLINQARQDLFNQLEQERTTAHKLRKQVADRAIHVAEFASQLADLASRADQQKEALLESDAQMQSLTARFDEVLSSKSWKLTRPVRALGHLVRRLKLLARALQQLLLEPAALGKNIARLFRVWRTGGSPAIKSALLAVQIGPSPTDAWRVYRQTFDAQLKPQIVRLIHEMPVTPRISIIVPTFNTGETMLREMLDSVKAQLYPHWELCIADDGSDQPHVKRILQEYAATDRRIRLFFGVENHGVSYASNRALELVTSKFVVLLDHDDLLEEHALFRVAECILQDLPDVFYSDEVLVTPDHATVLHFAYRPAFSPEYLRSHPYIVHLAGMRTQILRDIGGFDESLSISQDYDLILRAVEKAKCIVHIPEILYQWRILPSSAGEKKMHDVMATSKALLQRHLDRCSDGGIVYDGTGFNLFDTRYPLQENLKIAIIIPTKNHGDLLQQCIDSIRNTVSGIDYDIVVIDHESDDADTKTYLASIAHAVHILPYKGKFNFSAINNWAISQLTVTYSHYLFCNNDIEAIKPGWLGRMLELGQRTSVGIVGAKLFYPDRETIQHAGVCVGMYGVAEHYGKFLRLPKVSGDPKLPEILRSTHEVSAVTAACLLMRKDAFDRIGGFDEALAVGFGDVDLCLRVREYGFDVLYCAQAELLHHESYTRGKSLFDPHPEDSALFQAKWRKILVAGDPFYNPGFSLLNTYWHYTNPIPCHVDINRRVFNRQIDTGMRESAVNRRPVEA